MVSLCHIQLRFSDRLLDAPKETDLEGFGSCSTQVKGQNPCPSVNFKDSWSYRSQYPQRIVGISWLPHISLAESHSVFPNLFPVSIGWIRFLSVTYLNNAPMISSLCWWIMLTMNPEKMVIKPWCMLNIPIYTHVHMIWPWNHEIGETSVHHSWMDPSPITTTRALRRSWTSPGTAWGMKGWSTWRGTCHRGEASAEGISWW